MSGNSVPVALCINSNIKIKLAPATKHPAETAIRKDAIGGIARQNRILIVWLAIPPTARQGQAIIIHGFSGIIRFNIRMSSVSPVETNPNDVNRPTNNPNRSDSNPKRNAPTPNAMLETVYIWFNNSSLSSQFSSSPFHKSQNPFISGYWERRGKWLSFSPSSLQASTKKSFVLK